MANVVFGFSDRILGKTVTSDSVLLNLPPGNVATEQPSQVWRSVPGTTTAWLVVDFTSSQSIGVVAAIATNLSAAATWRVRLSTVDATGAAGDAHDSGMINAGVNPIERMAIRVLASTVSGRYLRVDFIDASLPYLEVGRLFAGVKWQPTRNYRFGSQVTFRDFSKGMYGDNGQYWALRGSMQKIISFSMPAITETERNTFGLSMTRNSGRFRDILVVLDPNSSDLGRDSVFGILEEVPIWELGFPGHHTVGFRVAERL
jgi:hypothetical protein